MCIYSTPIRTQFNFIEKNHSLEPSEQRRDEHKVHWIKKTPSFSAQLRHFGVQAHKVFIADLITFSSGIVWTCVYRSRLLCRVRFNARGDFAACKIDSYRTHIHRYSMTGDCGMGHKLVCNELLPH